MDKLVSSTINILSNPHQTCKFVGSYQDLLSIKDYSVGDIVIVGDTIYI